MNKRIARKISADSWTGRYSERQIQAAARRLGEWNELRMARAIVDFAVGGWMDDRWDALHCDGESTDGVFKEPT